MSIIKLHGYKFIFLKEVFVMEQEVTIIDVLKAFEPTGFSSGATDILGALAMIFIISLFSLFGYMMMNLILPIRRRADEFEELINDLDQNFKEQILSKEKFWSTNAYKT